MKTDIKKDLKYYLSLPYTVILRPDEESVWVAKIEELDGCVAHGTTQAEAITILDEIKVAWLEEALEIGDSIPEPVNLEGLPSGKWLQRVPRSLHKKLTRLATAEEVSLNQLVTAILAEAVGTKMEATRAASPAPDAWVSRGVFISHTKDDWEIHQPTATSMLDFVEALDFARSLESKETKSERIHATKKEHAYNA